MSKQNINRFIDTKNILSVASWEEIWGLGEKVKGLKIQIRSRLEDGGRIDGSFSHQHPESNLNYN